MDSIDENIQKLNSGDPRMGLIIKKHENPQITILGYPFDNNKLLVNKTKGCEYGPDCLRRFLPKLGPLINAEYLISIYDLKVSDSGNILETTFQEQIKHGKQIVENCLNNQEFPILIGGSKDLCYLTSNIQKYDGQILIDRSNFFLDPNFISLNPYGPINAKNLYFFGTQKICENNYMDLNQIRSSEFENHMDTIYEPITQGGLQFKHFLQKLSSLQSLHVQISLETINSLFCPGVSNQNVEIGLTAEEIIEIMFQIGKNQSIKSLAICDYNPTVEDFRTGRLLANMIYYCLLGFRGFRKISI